VDAEVLYAGGVGETERKRGWASGTGERHDRGGCGWDYSLKALKSVKGGGRESLLEFWFANEQL
jgi:hypothetical protein